MVEIFTVSKIVARAAENHGMRSETFDYVNAEHADITTAKGFHQAVQLLLRVKPHGLVVLAPDCSSFGFAPCSSTKRSKNNFAGGAQNPNVQTSNFMARISFFLFVLAWALDIEVIFENPAGSMIFSFLRQEINSLREIGKAPQLIYMDRCAFESGDKPTFKKRYKFMSSGAWLTKAARTCSCKMPHLKLMSRVEYEDGTVHINGNAHRKGSGLYPQPWVRLSSLLGNVHSAAAVPK